MYYKVIVSEPDPQKIGEMGLVNGVGCTWNGAKCVCPGVETA